MLKKKKDNFFYNNNLGIRALIMYFHSTFNDMINGCIYVHFCFFFLLVLMMFEDNY